MIDIRNKNLRFLIIGYGVSGRSTHAFLKSNGYPVAAFDDKILIEDSDIGNIADFGAVVKSPGVPFMPHNAHFIVKRAHEEGVPVITNYDVFSLFNNNARIIMVTGTNGKSTTAALIDHVMRKSEINSVVGGNIGVPYGDLPHSDVYVFEMSSYELAVSQYMNFEVGCILNIEPDHLENHGSFENYINAKHNGLAHSETKIISYEDRNTMAVYKNTSITISNRGNKKADVYIDNQKLIDNINKIEFGLSRLPALRGRHNHQNLAFAYVVCSNLGIPIDCILSGMESFESLPHRLNFTGTIGNVSFVNDSKATNPVASACALETFSEYNIFWIIGGRSKKTDVHEHVDAFMATVKKIYLIGEAMDEFEAAFKGMRETKRSETLERAVADAYNDAKKSSNNSVVLFSPMCASFDQFANYCERGNRFCQIVASISDTKSHR
ncbi:MAG: UDP-N-acetylmuramoyl-L-alanine--D-glutamate ligase [Holosporales bacterium]|nr:UDP-N-acetylmuramoyl-L-alanine--D-glutamate ligase [Holosporales bacterium]